jgi:hypothetical protein
MKSSRAINRVRVELVSDVSETVSVSRHSPKRRTRAHLTRLVAREDFTVNPCREIFRSYIILIRYFYFQKLNVGTFRRNYFSYLLVKILSLHSGKQTLKCRTYLLSSAFTYKPTSLLAFNRISSFLFMMLYFHQKY